MNFTSARKVLGQLFQDRVVAVNVFLSIVLLITGMVFLAVASGKLPPEVPLFMTQSWGKSQLAPSRALILLPGSLLLFLLVNLGLGAYYFSKHQLLARILSGATLACAVLQTITIWQIIALVSW